jgi:hypothetical protein
MYVGTVCLEILVPVIVLFGTSYSFRLVLGDCRNSFFVFVSDRSISGLAENLGQIRFS